MLIVWVLDRVGSNQDQASKAFLYQVSSRTYHAPSTIDVWTSLDPLTHSLFLSTRKGYKVEKVWRAGRSTYSRSQSARLTAGASCTSCSNSYLAHCSSLSPQQKYSPSAESVCGNTHTHAHTQRLKHTKTHKKSMVDLSCSFSCTKEVGTVPSKIYRLSS